MPRPVTIADDSRLSRKLIMHALPKDWDIDITEAVNGKEALAACSAGKAEVMFLDLNMPVMDGYEVLEFIKREGLKCFVIVISADIQPKAQERVQALGAMTFIKKPLQPPEVVRVLSEFGLL